MIWSLSNCVPSSPWRRRRATVSALEHEFGVRLISRDNHVAGLTPEGEKLCEMAKKLLDMAAEIEEKMHLS